MGTPHKIVPAQARPCRKLRRIRTRRLHWLTAAFAMAILAIGIPRLAVAESDQPAAHTVALLPLVMANPEFDPGQACSLNYQEVMLLDAMRHDPEQQREELHCNAILSRVARAHAQDMASRYYFGHVNPDGFGPNYLVTRAGYSLPDWYPDARDANNLESIGALFSTATKVWSAWVNSPGHRQHVLGMDEFFVGHTEIGVGYYSDPDSEYGAYWVLITAPPAQ